MATRIQPSRCSSLLYSGLILLLLAATALADRPLHQFSLPRAAEGHPHMAFAMAFSHDGSLLAIASHDRVFVYDMDNGRLNGTYRTSGEFTGDMLYDVGFSPDGTQVHALRSTAFDFNPAGLEEGLQDFEGDPGNLNPAAVPGLNASVEVLTWDLDTPGEAPQSQSFSLAGSFSNHELSYTNDFSPTQNLLAVCSTGGIGAGQPAYLLNLETNSQIELESMGDEDFLNFHSVSFSGDGKYLIAVGLGAVIWDVQTGKVFKDFDPEFRDGIALLSFHATITADHDHLLATHMDGYSLWSLETLRRTSGVGAVPQANQVQGGSYTPSAFSSDARAVAILSARGQMQMWDASREEAVDPFWAARSAYKDVALSPSGNFLAVLREDQNSLFVWEVPEEAVDHESALAEETTEAEDPDAADAASPTSPAPATELDEPASSPKTADPPPRHEPLEPTQAVRTWTIDGEPVEAALVRAGSISVILVTSEGEELRVPRGDIGDTDESYLNSLNR